MELFNDLFMSSLSDEPILALKAICKNFSNFDKSLSSEEENDNYDTYLEAYAIIKSITDSLDLQLPVHIPELIDNEDDNIIRIREYYLLLTDAVSKEAVKMNTNISLGKSQAKFDSFFGKKTIYEFSDGDITRIQVLISELRDLIKASKFIEDEHRNRLLNQLEKLQSELHKKMSDLNRFYVLIGDAGVVLGKFGQDAKPLVERIQEIVGIAWNSQARTEELQSGIINKLLSEKNTFEE